MPTNYEIDKLENRFIRPVYRALQKEISEFVSEAKKDFSEAERNIHTKIGSEQMSNVIRRLWLTVGLFFAKDTKRQIDKSEQKGFGINERWIKDIIDYLRTYLLNKAVIPITETTKKQILGALEKGQQEGWGVDRILRELENSDITMNRARVIVRTELVRAMWKGQQLAISESKWLTTETWLSAKDHRTRHSHRLMDGVQIDTGQKFKVPVFKRVGKIDFQVGVDLMSGPGDPSASAGNVINCRCTKTVRAKRDEQGRLIRKPVGFQVTL